MSLKKSIVCGLLCISLTACQSAYYGAWEKLGYEKRDILVERVDEAKESQEEAKDQFSSAFEEFAALTKFEGGDLQKQYDKLKSEFEKSEDRAEAVHDHIDSVESVAKALFKEWQQEIDLFSDASLRSQSENQLQGTQIKYNRLIGKMRTAENRIDPVIKAFRDRVLFLKHNLNARAVSNMSGDVLTVQADISQLIEDMNISIREANDFISTLKN